MGKTFVSAVMIGAIVEGKIAEQFAEAIKPHSTTEIIEGFIMSIMSGQLKMIREATNGD
jgi:hypothetical protein